MPLLATAACGGDDSGSDGGGDDGSGSNVQGTPHTYVVNQAMVPTSSAEAIMYGLDLGQMSSDVPDGTVDNQLGMTLSALTTFNFDVQGTITTAVNEGSIILLLTFTTTDYSAATNAGLKVDLGANPMPAPCNGSDDTTCGHHLDGTGSFDIAAGETDNAPLVGNVVGGKYTGGPGKLTLQIALGGTDAITLDLLQARAEGTGFSDTGVTTLKLGGMLTQAELNSTVIPAVAAQLEPIVMRDCTGTSPTSDPPCLCVDQSTGQTLISLFDGDHGNAKDCMITVDEVQMNGEVSTLLQPDVCSTASCGTTPDSLSLGIEVTAVKGTINP
ncbi:MAG TPA: hypothetical protein VGM88_07210 [Kofleriaceae bacterium]